MHRIVLLAAIGFGLGLTGKANADLAPPLPPNKEAVAIKIEVDEKAKSPRLIVPNQVYTGPRIRPNFKPKDTKTSLEQEDTDEVAENADPMKPRNNLLFAGVALTLSLSFGGMWLLRRNGKGSVRGLTLMIAAGATLMAGAIVWANAPPPPIKERPVGKQPVTYPFAWEGKTTVEFEYGAEPIRLILDKESYEKLKKGELKMPEVKPTK